MKETKRQHITFTCWDANGMEAHLERMAQQGWMLERIGFWGWKYQKCEPKALHFNVVFDAAVTSYDAEPSERQQTLSDLSAHSGWQLVYSNAEIQVFATELENPVPIYTDPSTRLEDLSRMAKNDVIPAWLNLAIALFLLGLLCWQWVERPIGLLLKPSPLLMSCFVCPALLWNGLTSLVTWYRWRHQAKLAAQQGELLPTRGHQIENTALLWLLILFLSIAALLYPPDERRRLLLLIGGFTVIALVVNGVRLWLKKKHMDADKNRNITFWVDLVLSIVLAVIVISAADDTGKVFHGDQTPPLLTVQILTNTEDSSYETYHYTENSPFLCRSSYGQYSSASLPELSYTLYDSHWSLVYQLCLREELHSFDWALDSHPDLAFTPIAPVPDGAEQIYALNQFINDSYPYIFCWENRIVALYPSWQLTPAQIVQAEAAFRP